MKTLIMLSLMSLPVFSWANMDKHHEEMEKKFDSMSFEDAKKMKTEMLEKKATMIESERKCVSDAKDKPALKACMKKMHEEMKGMHSMMKDKMKKK